MNGMDMTFYNSALQGYNELNKGIDYKLAQLASHIDCMLSKPIGEVSVHFFSPITSQNCEFSSVIIYTNNINESIVTGTTKVDKFNISLEFNVKLEQLNINDKLEILREVNYYFENIRINTLKARNNGEEI